MSDYPDHLNPFKERKKLGRTLGRSFREFKGFIRQSFRKKKSKSSTSEDFGDVEFRKPQDFSSYNTLRGNVMSLPVSATYSTYTITSPPLPRSRFKERLSRSSLNNTYNTFYDERCNPFAEEEGLNPFDEPPVPYRRRKSKKRAPLPPSCSNPDVNMGYKIRGSSKWSLTSSETDYTLDDKSEYSGDVTYSQCLRECLDNFNREMDTLNKESIEITDSLPERIDGKENKQTSEEETESIRKSKLSISSVDIENTREINNNQIEVLNTDETIPDNSETTFSTEIVLEDYNNDSDQESKSDIEHQTNEVSTELKNNGEEKRIMYTEEKNNEENSEEQKDNNEVNSDNNDKNESEETLKIAEAIAENLVNGNTEKVISESKEIPEEINEEKKENEIEEKPDSQNGSMIHDSGEKFEEYSTSNDENILTEEEPQEFHANKIKLQYIDEEYSINDDEPKEDQSTEHTNSKEPSPKQRKYKLNKVILLEENSIPK